MYRLIYYISIILNDIFSVGGTAALFSGVIWILSYIPAALLSMDVNISPAVQAFTCLSVNSAMSYGFQFLLSKESTGGKKYN